VLELLGALRLFTRSPSKLAFISKPLIGVLVKIVKVPPSEKVKQAAINALNNLAQSTELSKSIQQMGGPDLYNLMKSNRVPEP
jgi:hypothetical protein